MIEIISTENEGTAPRQGGRPSSLVEQKRTCPTCGTDFITKVHPNGKVAKGYKTTYCTRACSRQVANVRSGEVNRAKYEVNPRRCPCGVAIAYEDRHHVKSYCSPKCRKLYGKKKQLDPANYVTFACRNCGKEVTRYRKYGSGASMYCSNACASTHTKMKHHVAMRDEDVLLDSSWEAFYWGLCRLLKVAIERFDRDGCVDGYGPDFYLPGLGLYVEIKGVEDDADPSKWAAFRASGRQLMVLDRGALLALAAGTVVPA
jgi:endogenous inhibitor of DNA gyrase (YacG/DUF329 family)